MENLSIVRFIDPHARAREQQFESLRRHDNRALDRIRRRRRKPGDKYSLIGTLVFAIAGGLLGSLGPVYAIIGGAFGGAIVGAVVGDIIGKWRNPKDPPSEDA